MRARGAPHHGRASSGLGHSIRRARPSCTASQACCCLRTPPQAMPAALIEAHRPMPRCQTGSRWVWGLLLPHCDLHARRFSVPPQPLPHIENPNALMLSTGLFNPALCGGVTPHECLIRSARVLPQDLALALLRIGACLPPPSGHPMNV